MAPVTSSAINKSKTVAPKAIARRRPAPPAAKPQPRPTPSPGQHEPEQDAVEGALQHDKQPDTAQLTPPTTQQPVVAQPTAPVIQQPVVSPPTPPATQRPAVARPTPHTPQEPGTAQPTRPEPASQPDTATINARASSLSTPYQATPPAPLQTHAPSQNPSPSTRRITPPPPVAGAKRKRNGPPTPQQPPADIPPVQDTPVPDSQPTTQQRPVDAPSSQHTPIPDTQRDRSEDTPIQQSVEMHSASAAPMAPMAMMVSPERARKMAQQPTAPPAKAAPKPPPRAKRQKKTPATDNAEGDTDGNVTNPVDGDTARTEGCQADQMTAPIQRKRPKQRKQPKSASRVIEDEDGNIIDEPEPEPADEDGQPAAKQRKPRQPRKPREPRKKKDPKEVAAEYAGIGDPELHEVDPNAVTMSDLTRDRGLGKQSERETKMAGIDWDEVARKRLEAAEAIRAGKPLGLNGEAQDDANDNQEEGANANSQSRPSRSGPVLRMGVDGYMVVEEDSLRIDRLAQAEANAANLEITEEDDLTKRVNQMSWLSAKRKDPTERLPFFKMKSDPWGEDETDRFYEALKMFGTDFFIISKMFPPKTRRQIKLKFIREERLDADRINRALSGESTVPMSLDHFAEATGQDIGIFKDPRELEEELRAEGEEQREEIAKKKKEMEESKHQRDIQMAAREQEQAERAEQRKLKARQRMGRRGGLTGSGAL